eukprot:4199-Heterococcus_DN1.PRE.2
MAKHFERLYAAWVEHYADKAVPFDDPLAQPWEHACRACLTPGVYNICCIKYSEHYVLLHSVIEYV